VSASAHAGGDRNPDRGDLILAINCGSSSIKYALFDSSQQPLPRMPVWKGKVQGIGGPAPTCGETGLAPRPAKLDPAQPYHSALELIRERVQLRLDGRKLFAIAHRVVHGGRKYFEAVRVDAAVLTELKSCIPLAPLHQPFALEVIESLLVSQPELPQVACFDTGFHHAIPLVEQILPLPWAAWKRGIRRFGFHGLSYEYQSIVLAERHGPLARGRTIVAHLGSGASLCAMQQLRSVATTMGFSALDGLMMGTRPGALDPGALLYLMEIEKLTLEQVTHLLYHESGLLGLSGISSEPHVLVEHEGDDGEAGERVRIALQLYVRRIVREIGALVAVLGGLDMLVFTGGVGEHNAVIRERVCAAIGWLGVNLDPGANSQHAPVITLDDSRVRVMVEPTNEEWIVATQALSCLGHAAAGPAP
jgi:acetate kinase